MITNFVMGLKLVRLFEMLTAVKLDNDDQNVLYMSYFLFEKIFENIL